MTTFKQFVDSYSTQKKFYGTLQVCAGVEHGGGKTSAMLQKKWPHYFL